MSRSIQEPLFATASTVRSWLLLEHAGPWGRNAFVDGRLPPDLGRSLAKRAGAHGVRPLLIRAIERGEHSEVRCFAAYSGPDAPWIERVPLEAIDDALDIDLGALRRGTSVGGEPHAGPLFLVCTHGRHDPCCAERGRPLARALTAAFPGATWECSHIGGDRFAGNVVAFPHGLYFGRVEPQDAAGLARSYAEGRIDLDRYRGRSCYPTATQAAEQFVRSALGLDAVDGIQVQQVDEDDAGATIVLRTPTGPLRVAVGRERGEAHRLTCHSEEAQAPPVYRLRGIETLTGEDPYP